jgi:hypothetical protein
MLFTKFATVVMGRSGYLVLNSAVSDSRLLNADAYLRESQGAGPRVDDEGVLPGHHRQIKGARIGFQCPTTLLGRRKTWG